MNPTNQQEDSKYNLYYRHYDSLSIDQAVLEKIKWHEEQVLELRRSAGMTATIYIPQDHPTVGFSLIKKGRRVMWIDRAIPINKKSGKREYGIVDEFVRIEAEQVERELTERGSDDYLLREIDYNGCPYMKLDVLIERLEPVIMIKAHNMHTLLHEKKFGKNQ